MLAVCLLEIERTNAAAFYVGECGLYPLISEILICLMSFQ